MDRRLDSFASIAAALAMLLSPAAGLAQQPAAPTPLYPGAAPRSFEAHPLPSPQPAPVAGMPAPAQSLPKASAPPPAAPAQATMSPPEGRIFCEQPVSALLADRETVPRRYRRFVGMWADASWTPQLCAALIVANVTPDGTATIVYVFGPMGPSNGARGGVLNGTGIIRNGELRFENSDGSQFAFRPFYADLQGRLTTPQGQSYDAIFKKQL